MSSPVLPNRAVIRSARPSDRRFLFELSEEVFARYSSNPTSLMRRMLEEGTTLVAEHRSIRLGFATIEVSTKRAAYASFGAPRLAHLAAIAVRPEAAGVGVGTQLLAAAEDAAREQGAISMSLLTAEANFIAHRLFRRAGYQPILGIENAYRGAHDGVRMLKSLTIGRE